jgi:phage gp46-like protein
VWELQSAKLTPDLPELARMYAVEALKPLVTAGILGSVTATVAFLLAPGGAKKGLSVDLLIKAPTGEPQTLHYEHLWGAA